MKTNIEKKSLVVCEHLCHEKNSNRRIGKKNANSFAPENGKLFMLPRVYLYTTSRVCTRYCH